MKKPTFYLICILLVCALTSCPSSHNFPVDKPSIPVENLFLGKFVDEKGEIYGRRDLIKANIEVAKRSDFEYKIDINYISTEKDGSFSEDYAGHVSVLDGQSFLNVHSSKVSVEKDSLFYIYKLSQANGDIMITPVLNCWQSKIKNQEEMTGFIKRNISNELLYGNVIKIKKG